MSAIDDLATAIREYPDTHITLEIISFTPAGGTVLNQSEEATFMVRVTNNGLLEMLDVTLSIAAESGALLKRPLVIDSPPLKQPVAAGAARNQVVESTWVSGLTSKSIASIAADGGQATTESFTLKAPPGATNPLPVNLLTVTLNDWTASLTHLLVAKSIARPANLKDTHSAVVHPL